MATFNQEDNTDSNSDVEFIKLITAIDDSTSSSSDSSDDEIQHHPKVNKFVETIEEFNNLDLKSHMRLKRSTINYLIERYQNDTSANEQNAGRPILPAKIVVYMYLWYISNTLTYRQLGNLFGVTKSTAWLVVRRAVAWIKSISNEFISWPTGQELQETCRKFEEKKGIPGVVGAIDCTHITINAPHINKESYFNRKKDYSLILQAIVDADKKFIDVYCGEPGSMHDSRVFRRSPFYTNVQEYQPTLLPNETFIIGDSAYKCTNWLITPFKDNGRLTVHQRRFNYAHSATRIPVENAFGALKGRFRRLLKFTEHRDLSFITNLIVSACVLHNLCIMKEDEQDVAEETINNQQQNEIIDLPLEQQQTTRRDTLFNYLLEKKLI